MEGMARAQFLRGSARKMRRVAAVVKGLGVDHAAAVLRTMPQGAAVPLAKVIQSARANALAVEGTAHHKAEGFVVTEVLVDGGPIAKRFRPMSMGRAYRIRKRFCHLRVIVSDEVEMPGRSSRRKDAAKSAEAGSAPSGDSKD